MSFTPSEEKNFLGKPIEDIQVLCSDGNSVSIYSFLGDKPVVLSPIYTKCPHSCNLITANLKSVIDDLGNIGENYHVLSFSFDHKDTPEDLQTFENRWGIKDHNWNVVTASKESVDILLASINFLIEYDSLTGDYAHPNEAIVLSPSGKISRYIYGVKPKKTDLKISILEAKQEKYSLGIYEGLLLRCYRYDPATGTYVIDWSFIIQVSVGGVIIICLLTYLLRGVFIKTRQVSYR